MLSAVEDSGGSPDSDWCKQSSEMSVRGPLIDIQRLPSVKRLPQKVQTQNLIRCLLQTFSIYRSDTPQGRYNGVKQLIETEGQEKLLNVRYFGPGKQRLRESTIK